MTDTHTMRFMYAGKQRVVHEAVRRFNESGNEVIVGRELIKGSRITDECKAYRVDRVSDLEVDPPSLALPQT